MPPAVADTTIEAVSVPVTVGVNVTEIWQFALTASELGQLLVSEKSPALIPVVATLESGNETVPVLGIVIVCAALVVPMFCEAKVRLVGLKLTIWDAAVIVMERFCDTLAAQAPDVTAQILPKLAALRATLPQG